MEQAASSSSSLVVDERIVRFLKRHHVMTLATATPDVQTGCPIPYCSHAFYCYDAARNLLVFTSDGATRHGRELALNGRVAASVALETCIVGRVQGVQICGEAVRADEGARKVYLRRFPYAALSDLTLWVIAPDYMKMTDNTLGFGKKLIWEQK